MAKSKSSTAKPAARTAPAAPEPAVMAAGASEENAEQGKGSPPADKPDAQDKALDPAAEGFRTETGQFTGKPATLEEKVDALIGMAERNGWSLPKELHRPKE